MGHITSKSYQKLQSRLDKHPQGAPESESLFKILEILFTESEAETLSKLPLVFFTALEASKRLEKSVTETKIILNTLADKGILMDVRKNNYQLYILAPTMAGFFEFSLMRTDGLFNRKILSELFYKYINEEDQFIKKALQQKTPIGRTFVHEDQIQEKSKSEILEYEKASHIIDSATCITVGDCYCRHKMEHLGKSCKAPQDVCLTFNQAAESLSKHRIAKEISKKEAHDILDKCVKLGLVQIGDNVQDGVNWICNCCGCCCEALTAYVRVGYTDKINSNYFAKIDTALCTKCGIYQNKCPVKIIKSIDGSLSLDPKNCLGCGVCTRFCPQKAISLIRRKNDMFVPQNSFERILLNAIERGKLQNYIFDNFDLWTNEVLRHLLKALLALTPLNFALANKQLKSRFLKAITKSKTYKKFGDLYSDGEKFSHTESEEN